MANDTDVGLERQLVWLTIGEPNKRRQLFKSIRPEWFFLQIHRVIFETAFDLYLSGRPFGVVELKTNLVGNAVVSEQEIIDLLSVADEDVGQLEPLINRLRNLYLKRRALSCLVIAVDDLEHDLNPMQVAGKVSRELIGVTGGANPDVDPDPETLVSDAMCRYASPRPAGMNTGIHIIDGWTGGIVSGRLYVLAATKKTGKTRLTVAMLSNLASCGTACTMISLEMRPSEITDLLFAYLAKVDSSRIQNQTVRETDRVKLSIAATTVHNLLGKMKVTYPGIVTRDGLAAIIRLHASFHKSKVIAIDFLGKIAIDVKHENAETGQICAMLADLSRELNIAIVLVAQLNKMAETEKEPNIGLVEGSGRITQFADVIMLLVNERRTGEQKEVDADHQRLRIHFTQRSGANSPFVPMNARLQFLDFNVPVVEGF